MGACIQVRERGGQRICCQTGPKVREGEGSVSNRVLIMQNTNEESASTTAAADPFSSRLQLGSTCYKLSLPSCTIGSVI